MNAASLSAVAARSALALKPTIVRAQLLIDNAAPASPLTERFYLIRTIVGAGRSVHLDLPCERHRHLMFSLESELLSQHLPSQWQNRLAQEAPRSRIPDMHR